MKIEEIFYFRKKSQVSTHLSGKSLKLIVINGAVIFSIFIHFEWDITLTILNVIVCFNSSTVGYCSVQYDVCDDETSSFSISTPAFSPFATSQVDINCAGDHIVIEGLYIYPISPPM